MTVASILQVSGSDAAAAVSDAEFHRLLGVPRGREVPVEVAERAGLARRWYEEHGRPFVATRRLALAAISHDAVTLRSGDVLAGPALADRLRDGEAHALVVAAFSAGREVADEAARLWADARPDESYFLDRFAAAVVEQLVWRASAVLCADATATGEGLLQHLSPGCGRWDLSAQHALMALLLGTTGHQADAWSIGPIRLLESGALHPQHSLLAALGVTRRAIVVTSESACRNCDLRHCRYRRAAYARDAAEPGTTE
ncbi:MAG TPA: hypothetical protein PK163_00165 [Steroidobacteraceae bacterium]|nr:hypothetical protein [Steroidobacteraceae bacterium]